MNYLISLLIFIIVLFFYIHIYHHFKTSNDLEVYTIENPSRDRLEEVCNIRQPFVFNLSNKEILNIFRLDNLIQNFGQFDIKIRNIKNIDDESEMHLPFSLSESELLLKNDKQNKYITERNIDFLSDTGLIKYLNQNDELLKPPMVSNSFYDYQCAAKNTTTPLRYSVNYRNYIYVIEGAVKLKLVCPDDTRYLNQIKDYENFEFRSPLDIWDVQDEYSADFGKLRVLDLDLERNSILYIPAYWWYSIKFGESSSICTFQYRTYMNNIAILPELLMSFLQRQNIKHNLMKKFEPQKIKEKKKEPEEIILEYEIQETKEKKDKKKDDDEDTVKKNIESLD